MNQDDRKTPRDPIPAVAPRPARSEQTQREDAQRAMREAGSAARQAARGKAPPVPFDPTPIRDRREQERHRTPESGGIEAPVRALPSVEIETIESVPPRSRAPTRSDWSKLWFKLATAAVGAVVLVIGALGYFAVTAINAKAEAYKAELKAKAQAAQDRETTWRKWAAANVAVDECRHEKQAKLNARQFPATPSAGTGPWPTWKDECGEKPRMP